MKLLVTGGAGFIGSNFVRYLLARHDETEIVNLDKLTYAGNLENLGDAVDHPRCRFLLADIANREAVNEVLAQGFDGVVNFASETHVDRSIDDASPFLCTNIFGTHVLLEGVRTYRVPLFIHISTDEVYGSAAPGQSFREDAALNPGSPYASSKAAADLLVRAYVNTYALPAVILRGTNNYGPYQFPEKLIPLTIANAFENKSVPLYGDGLHERDWLYVEDFCRGIAQILERGRPGEIYNLSSGRTQSNLQVVRAILKLLGKPDSLIRFVEDRPGHDRRYSLDSTKIRQALGWKPEVSFEEGIEKVIVWYQTNTSWLKRARSKEYREYYDRHYERRPKASRSIV